MKKNTYKLNNIDCAACALKIEEGVNKLEGVHSSSLNYMFMKLIVSFDETIISDEEIEKCIHQSLRNVEITEKNNEKFLDVYEEPGVFKKMLFKPKKRK